jgi:diaminohydroxyphosphoribosylaminopyrimidine deaminase/5-amino-6-(5-phosphoribosylamino)uracil reductase
MAGTDDERWMVRALELAEKGRGLTRPNPMVGAVIVRDGRLVGQGYHERAGLPHAEVHALTASQAEATGATLYVNLEPCSHAGRTPPCTEAILKAGIERVVCAVEDPNPMVSGRGIRRLREAGIHVDVGCMVDAAEKLNEVYLKYMRKGIPFVSLKIAQTIDGRIAASNGSSRWITGEESRRCVHTLRSQHDAVLVGVNTVVEDDPQLTVRFVEGENPIRIILDRTLRVPLESKIVKGDGLIRTIIATSELSDPSKKEQLREKGVAIWDFPLNERGNIDLKVLLRRAAHQDITSILVEGGSEVFSIFLQSGLTDKVYVFIAPTLLGSGRSSIMDIGIDTITSALRLRDVDCQRYGEDALITGYIS